MRRVQYFAEFRRLQATSKMKKGIRMDAFHKSIFLELRFFLVEHIINHSVLLFDRPFGWVRNSTSPRVNFIAALSASAK
jgi:hypothetical protein